MAAPKFPLTLRDGSKVRTLEQLRAHADLCDLEEHFRDRSLHRWLNTWDYPEAEAVEALDTEAEDVLDRLCEILGIQVTEEMREDYQKATAKPTSFRELILEMARVINSGLERGYMSSTVADDIAKRLNAESDDFVFFETKRYILFASLNSHNLLADFPWYRADKIAGTIERFSIQPTDDANMLRYWEAKLKCQGKCFSTNGDSIIYENKQHIVILDIAQQSIKAIDKYAICPFGLCFADHATNDAVAFTVSSQPYLATAQNALEITIGGHSIRAGALALYKDVLYFYCEETAGLLGDKSDPNGCYCCYDRKSGKISIVVSKEKIDKLGGPIPYALYGNNLFCIYPEAGRKAGIKSATHTSFPYPGLSQYMPTFENLWCTVNIQTGNITLHKKDEFRGSYASVSVQTCTNGVLLLKKEGGAQAYFIDYTDEEKVIQLPGTVASSGRPFLLGRSVYYGYTYQNVDQRIRFKVSLDDPTHPIQL